MTEERFEPDFDPQPDPAESNGSPIESSDTTPEVSSKTPDPEERGPINPKTLQPWDMPVSEPNEEE